MSSIFKMNNVLDFTNEQLLSFIRANNLTDKLIQQIKAKPASTPIKVVTPNQTKEAYKPMTTKLTSKLFPKAKKAVARGIPKILDLPPPVVRPGFKDVIDKIEGKGKYRKVPKNLSKADTIAWIEGKQVTGQGKKTMIQQASAEDIIRYIESGSIKLSKRTNQPIYVQKYTIDFTLRNTFEIPKFTGVGYTYFPHQQNSVIAINENNEKPITDGVMRAFNKVKAAGRKRFPQGFTTAVKTVIELPGAKADKKKKKSEGYFNMSMTDPTASEYKVRLREKVINKFHGGKSGGDTPQLHSLTFFLFPFNVKGGCANRCRTAKTLRYKNRTIKLISPKSSNHNCLIMAVIHGLKLKGKDKGGNNVDMKKLREELDIPPGKIHYSRVPDIAQHFDTGYVLINERQEIIMSDGILNDPVHIMLMKEHYYVVKYVDKIKKKQCEGGCGRLLNVTNTKHVCTKPRIVYRNNMIEKKQSLVSMKKCKEPAVIDSDRMIFFDLETFQESISHVPYACGYTQGLQEVQIDYGKDCMNNFVDMLLRCKDKYITAYNGSGFDFYFLIDILNGRNTDVKNIIMNNGAILSFEFGENNKVFDLYRFINCSLEDACNGFKIENVKMKFDVLKIQSWDDSEEHEMEVRPYLKYDVLALRELFFTFNNTMYNLEQINITSYLTLSHMAYRIWQSNLDELVEIPNDLEKYNFIRQAIYGARTYPQKRNFESKHHQDVVEGKMTYEELKKTGEYIYNADVTSLYSAVMKGVPGICEVKYPTGFSRWSDEPEKEYNDQKLGFYEVLFSCPDIRIPVLPRKKSNIDGLEWSLLDGKGIYTNVDIENAISSGYTVEFIGACLVWDTSGDVFGTYVDRYYEMKAKAETEKNPTVRSIAKLLLNSIYGKMLQRSIPERTNIISKYQDLLDVLRDNDLSEISLLGNGNLLVSSTVKDIQSTISKPTQLGCFILAYSRRLMLHYMKTIDPELKEIIFTYTDTDSLHLYGKDAMKLMEKGYIVSKENSQLGYLCNDIDKGDGIITKEINLAPKCYYYEYLTNDDKFHEEGDATFKCKGIPKRVLSHDLYNDSSSSSKSGKVVEFSGLKKKHINLTRSDVENGVNHFSIVNNTQTRTFMLEEWNAMDFVEGEWFPKGYGSGNEDKDYYLL